MYYDYGYEPNVQKAKANPLQIPKSNVNPWRILK